MNEDALKSLMRHIRRRMVQYLPSVVDETYHLGRLTAKLFPMWVDSDFKEFEDFLVHRGLPAKLGPMAFAYYEVPSIEIWRQIGYTAVLRSSQGHRDVRLDSLLDNGANPLDVLTID